MNFSRCKQQWIASWCGFDLVSLSQKALLQVTPIEKWLLLFNIIMVGLAAIGFILNHFFIHYFILLNFVSFIPGSLIIVLLIGIWSSANRAHFPKLTSLLLSFFYTVLVSSCLGVLALAVMLTPSPWVLSYQLLHIDQWMGFHQIHVMHWMGRHLQLAQTFAWAYESWGWQALLVAPVLTICKQFPRACYFLFYSTILSLVFCLIYVIWPSLSPAAALPEHIFADSCYACIHRFELLRHHHYYAFGTCGLIDFPSYHAAIAMLAIWACWRIKGLNLIVIILNTWIILATFLLGYHFLVDVIASFVIVAAMLLIGNKKAVQKNGSFKKIFLKLIKQYV